MFTWHVMLMKNKTSKVKTSSKQKVYILVLFCSLLAWAPQVWLAPILRLDQLKSRMGHSLWITILIHSRGSNILQRQTVRGLPPRTTTASPLNLTTVFKRTSHNHSHNQTSKSTKCFVRTVTRSGLKVSSPNDQLFGSTMDQFLIGCKSALVFFFSLQILLCCYISRKFITDAIHWLLSLVGSTYLIFI